MARPSDLKIMIELISQASTEAIQAQVEQLKGQLPRTPERPTLACLRPSGLVMRQGDNH